jgi:phosphatidyl-myo-inositol dimannoside synthase
MDILFVSQKYHPAVGGIETQTRMLAHELARRHRVEVAAARFRDNRLSAAHYLKKLWMREESLILPRYESYLNDEVPVHALRLSALERLFILSIKVRGTRRAGRYHYRSPLRFGYRFYRAAYVPKLRALMRGKDVVHSVACEYLGWAAEEAARAEGVPFVLSAYVHPGHWGDDPENVAFYNRADVVFALLESDRQKLIDLGVAAERVRLSGVVPLLPETSDPHGFRARYGLGDKPVVLFVGRLEEYKGPLALLDAAAQVWQEMPEVNFLFAGPIGAGNEALQWFAERRDERIRYLGLVGEQEKADAMAACDLFSMPSTGEVLPAVYLEAWRYGKPVLGGTAHGLPELIESSGAGLTVEQNPQLIATRLLELLRDEPRRRRMGERGRELVERRYSKQALVRTLEETYEEVCRARATQENAMASLPAMTRGFHNDPT